MKYYQNWQGRIVPAPGSAGEEWFPAEVPGNIQYDWAVSQGFADTIMYGTNAKRFAAVEDVTWEYRTRLDYVPTPGKKLFFVAEGVDYACEVLLDGVKIASHTGMYTPVEVDVTEMAHPGATLSVLICPHPKIPGAKPTRDQAAQSVKPPSVYGWDWNPRLLISGLWMPAYLEYRDECYIENCEPFYTLDKERKNAHVRFETVCKLPVHYTVWDREGQVVYCGDDPEFDLTDIHLWWCNGQGEPYLYRWSARSGEGMSGDERVGRIGFRTLKLVLNEGAIKEPTSFPKSRYPAPMTLELNGRRIFGKGSNWVNPEIFFGRITDDRYRELLTAARDANMNILRLWGGSGFKKPAFYDLCDEMGILLWQEFVLACNNYRGTPEYLAVLEQESAHMIKTLRRHPSLAFWCGGNELFNGWSGMTDQSHALRLLDKLCYELDFDRPYLMTSPLNGTMHGPYVFEFNDKQIYEMFQTAHGTGYCEFGVPSATSVENLKKIIPEDELFPIEQTENWLYHHAFHAWGKVGWLCMNLVEKYFGTPGCLEDVVRETQWLQCEGYKAIFEEARRQWPYCSMAINWCFDEPWLTAANNALLMYPAERRPAYYAVTDALRPALPSARFAKFDWTAGETFTAQLWYLSDQPTPVSDTVTVTWELDGRTYPLAVWKTGDIPANQNLCGPEVSFVLPKAEAGALTLRLDTASGLSHSYRLLYRPENPQKA